MTVNQRNRRDRRPLTWGAALLVLTLLPSCNDEAEALDDLLTVGPEAAAAWTGSLRAGIEAMEGHADEGELGEALRTANRMVRPDGFARFRGRLERWTRGVSESVLAPITGVLDAFGIDALDSADRAEVDFARGLVLVEVTGDPDAATSLGIEDPGGAADAAFARARAAGGAARADAIATLGMLDLVRGETLRATLPEVAGPGAMPPAPGGDPQEDALEEARGFYRAAREHFVERLTMASPGAVPENSADDAVPLEDVRASVELVIRRLRELDEIEEQREQQQENEDQQDEGEEGKDDKDKKDDESEEKDEQNKDKGEESDDESDDRGEQSEGEEPPPDDTGDEPEEDPEKTPEEEDKEEDKEADAPESEEDGEDGEEEDPATPEPGEEEAKEPEISEERMTSEELQRFFERRKQYEEEGERRRRALRIKRKIPTQRDW